MGKRTLGNGVDDDSSDDDEEENEKSVVLNNGNGSDSSNKEVVDGSSDSVTGGKQDAELSGGGSSESGSEEEKETLPPQMLESAGSSDGEIAAEEKNGVVEPPELNEEKVVEITEPSLEPTSVPAIAVAEESSAELVAVKMEGVTGQTPNVSGEEGVKNVTVDAEDGDVCATKSALHEETTCANTNGGDQEKPLNFDDFNSAADMEVLTRLSSLYLFVSLFVTQ